MQSPEFAFHLLEILGTGSYGTVCVAEPVDEDRRVVIKVLQPDLLQQTDILARTRDEARLLQRLDHPNIVAVERLLEHDGRPVVVMEHIDGLDLDTVLRNFQVGLPGPEVLEIVRQVANALDAAWNSAPTQGGRPLRVVHRDIKPSNVIVSRTGEVKVVDFGLARAEFEDREASTDVLLYGAIAYMSPERFDGAEADPTMDIYALGILLTVLLSARVPVLPRSARRHDKALASQLDKLTPRGLPSPVVTDIRALIQLMCAHAPTVRPPAAEVAGQLARLLQRCPAPDMGGFGRKHVVRLSSSREAVAPQKHEDWKLVAFLDEGTQHGEAPVLEPVSPDQAGALTRLLSMFLGRR